MSPAVERAGPYLLREELGRGAMGTVHRAHDPGLDREVAVKLLPLPGATPVELARFRLEARAAAGLRHPGIVRVLGAGEDRGRAWVAMELVPGESLAERLRRGPLPPAEVARLGARLAQALAHAHERGVVHRDLKPENVLLGPAGEPVLVDFGLAKLLGRGSLVLSATGELLGTPAYMAPEQVRGDPAAIGPATDLYGLGATLLHALGGSPPFPGASVLETLERVLAAPPDLAPARARSPRLAALLARCLEKEPARRPASAVELARALEGHAASGRRGWVRQVVLGALLAGPPLVGWVGWLTAEARARRAAPSLPAPAPAPARPAPAGGQRPAPGPAPPQASASPAVLELLTQATSLLRSGQVAAAEERFERALVLDPACLPARLGRARLLTARAGSDRDAAVEAREAWRQVTRLELRSLEAWLAIAELSTVLSDPVGSAEAVAAASWHPAGKLVVEASRITDPARCLDVLEQARVLAPSSTQVLARMAVARWALGDLARAEADARRVLELDPACALAWQVFAAVQGARGAHGSARRAAERLAALSPRSPEGWGLLADACLELGDLEQAQRARQELERAGPVVPSWLLQARFLLAQGRAEEALEQVRAGGDSARVSPEQRRSLQARALLALGRLDEAGEALAGLFGAEARLLRARLLLAREDDAQALAELEAVLEVDPGHVTARLLRARTLVRLRRTADALEDAERALRADPELPEGLETRGDVHLGRGEHRAALDDFERALALDPRRPVALTGRAVLELLRGDGAAAVELLDRARALGAPQTPRVFTLRGLARFLCRDLPGAAAELDQAERSGDCSGDPEHLALRARLVSQVDLQGAIVLARRAVELVPDHVEALEVLGTLLFQGGALDEAGPYLDRALELAPSRPRLRTTRANLREVQGDLRGAEADLDQVLAVHPQDLVALHSRGAVRARLGQVEGALADLELAARLAPPDYPEREALLEDLAGARAAAGR